MDAPHLDRQVILKKKEHFRVASGHPWIFSNEIAEVRGSPAAGDFVEALDAGGRSLGSGLYHPHSLIALRLHSRAIEEPDESFFLRRLHDARVLRERIYPGETVWRLAHGESDFLPGLIVDRFDDHFVVQTLSLGMDRRLETICGALEELFQPAAIVERNESGLRALEGLPARRGVLRGAPSPRLITDLGIRMTVDVLEGQKTGHFLDQRENRRLVGRLCAGTEVLDCFCNEGGFALHAARGGARAVYGLDTSTQAVSRAGENARLNGFAVCSFERADVFKRLGSLHEEGRVFDVVVLDPPSFTHSRKHVPVARKAYRHLHDAALRLLKRGGLLVTSSCSFHITTDTFLEIVRVACLDAARPVQLIEWRGAAPDHPTLPGVPETSYLKFGVFRVL
jgi:23S rRNA (cytosine1962-C5)-methyltransferase